MKILLFAILILNLTFPHISYAKGNLPIVTPRPLAHNSKIRVFSYKEDTIYRYVGTYKFQSHIKFQQGETIQTISMGDTSGWEMIPSGNRLFLRPLNNRAKTNMTLITNKRLYQFLLDATSVQSFKDSNALFQVRFLYDDDTNGGFTVIKQDDDAVVDLSEPGKYNFNYTFTGPNKIAPVKVFDDGDFTYFEFREKDAEIPAMFYVDSDGYEGLVNYRVRGKYIIIERLSAVFTLRHGTDTVCVFNEVMKQKENRNKNI